ncbi:hypothetical protein GGS26DRAFT_601270 [Hypomontagnella submonticulosa]|nr:hypothetical protein GGS26DRAFT_601270 [Hypomontagnella submonticulosa]
MDSQTPPEQNLSGVFIIEPTSKHTHSFILLHRTGLTGEEFGKELAEMYLCFDGRNLIQKFPCARFILPTTPPHQPYERDPEWSFDRVDPGYSPAQTTVVRQILYLIEREAQDIPRQNIIIGGCRRSIVLSSLLACNFSIGGFVGLSVYLEHCPPTGTGIESDGEHRENMNTHPGNESNDSVGESLNSLYYSDFDRISRLAAIVREVRHKRKVLGLGTVDIPSENETSINTPIFLGCDETDETSDWHQTLQARGYLRELGYSVSFDVYTEGGRDWAPQQLKDIIDFLQAKVGLNPTNS